MCSKRVYGKYLFNTATASDNESERKINLVEVQQLDNLDAFSIRSEIRSGFVQ